MDKKRIFITLTVCLILIITCFFLYKKTFSTSDITYVFEKLDETTISKKNMQKLVVRTANAFYKNKEYIQFDSSYYALDDEHKYMFRNLSITPEDLNINNTVNMDNVSFIFSVYLNSIYYNIVSDVTNTSVNYSTGENLDISNILDILKKRDNRLIVDGNSTSNNTPSKQESFITYYKSMLEEGDIIIYTDKDDNTYLALYVGNNECMYLYGDSYDFSTGKNKLESNSLYKSSVDSYLFDSNKFKSDVNYYAILRPINSIDFVNDEVTYKIPVNSLSRVENVYIRKYSDVSSNVLYSNEEFNTTIEIINDGLTDITVKNVVENISSVLFVNNVSNDGTINNNTITWKNVNVPARSSIKLVYNLSAPSIKTGDKLVISPSKSELNINEYTMFLNDKSYVVANKFISSQSDQINKIITSISDKSSMFEYSTDLAYKDDYKKDIESVTSDNIVHLSNKTFIDYVYYNSFGYDFKEKFQEFFDVDKMVENFFVKEKDKYLLNEKFENKDVYKLFVDSMIGFGGKKSSGVSNYIFSSVINTKYTFNNLISGDILVLYNEENDSLLPTMYLYIGDGKFISYDGKFNVISENNSIDLFSSIYVKDLFLVFRPSYIFDIPLIDVEISPINLKLNGEKKIEYKRIPSNATINKVEYSESDKYSVTDGVIKALVTGNHTLNIKFNGNISKDVIVSVLKEIYNFSFNTNYDVDEDNKIIYVGEDNVVNTITSNFTFSESNINIDVYDSEHNKLTNLITDEAIVEMSSNGDLIKQYKLINFNFEPIGDVDFVDGKNIVKYIDVNTTVSQIIDMFRFNDDIVKINVKDNNNVEIQGDTKLATGNVLTISVSNKLNYSYQLSVLGDVSGNGIFNPNDLIRTRRYFVGWVNPATNEPLTLEGAYYYALDMTKNNVINLNDLIRLRRKLVDD